MYFQPYIYICISLHGEVAVLVKRCYTQTDTLKPWDGPYYRMGPSKNTVRPLVTEFEKKQVDFEQIHSAKLVSLHPQIAHLSNLFLTLPTPRNHETYGNQPSTGESPGPPLTRHQSRPPLNVKK